MTIHRTHQLITFECDECGETFDTETADFNAARVKAKDEGWKTSKVDDEWHHKCMTCDKAKAAAKLGKTGLA